MSYVGRRGGLPTGARLLLWVAGALLVVAGTARVTGHAGPGSSPTPAEQPVVAADTAPPAAERTSPSDDPSGTAAAAEDPSPAPTPPPGSPSVSATSAPMPGPTSRAAVGATWTVVGIVDGDTLDVRATDGTGERIRVIGIDTPERGECGFAEAREALAALVDGRDVRLVAGARDDRDRYDRLLRYVEVGAVDAGRSLIDDGLAVARYDSRDGYGRHPREDAYVAAQRANTRFTCDAAAPPTPRSPPTAEPAAEPGGAGGRPPGGNPWGTASCDPAYDPCVPPVSETGDLDCPDIRVHHRDGVRVDHAHGDPHRLDRDRDGHGCE